MTQNYIPKAFVDFSKFKTNERSKDNEESITTEKNEKVRRTNAWKKAEKKN